MSKKRTLDAFFGSAPKKPRSDNQETDNDAPVIKSHHRHYPFPIANLPSSLSRDIPSLPARAGNAANNHPDLDLLHFEPYIPGYLARELFKFLRLELPFYRVEYTIKRGGTETRVRTPRWTTVFGLDETSRFDEGGCVVDAKTGVKVPNGRYDKYPPRPIPPCLDALRQSTEAATNCKFNFCLVNYYASGADSISYHSDNEGFLGPDPAIASFSLGSRRDFLMKHRPEPGGAGGPSVASESERIKLPLDSGDMILMRGSTQSKWLHSIPKRTGKNEEDGGRINITFRRAMAKEGTENYYNYNVGTGPVYRWNKETLQMTRWKP